MNENELAKIVLDHCFSIHSTLGPGLLESTYKECLAFKLIKEGFLVEREKSVPVVFEGQFIAGAYRLDLLINNKLLIELKSVEFIAPVHMAQTLTYLKLGNYKLGLLINFNVVHFKNGIKRFANGLED